MMLEPGKKYTIEIVIKDSENHATQPTYNRSMVSEMEVSKITNKLKTTNLSSIIRPLLTLWITLLFTVTLTVGLILKKLSFSDYITTMGPIMSMLIGFWFGERSALKDPKKTHTDD